LRYDSSDFSQVQSHFINLQKEYNDFKENSVDLEKYKKLQEDMKRKKQRMNTLLEENEHLTKINSD